MFRGGRLLFTFASFALLLTQPALAQSGGLSAQERDTLQRKLQTFWSEVDLVVRNERSDLSDIRRQERQFQAFGVFDKIPIAHGKIDEASFRDELTPSLAKAGIKLAGLRIVTRPKPPKPIPSEVSSREEDFHLEESQITQKYALELDLEGDQKAVEQWSTDWANSKTPASENGESYPPLLEWDGDAHAPTGSGNRWKLRVAAYLFRDIQFPKIVAPSPRELLPSWAKSDTAKFAAQEPQLWGFVEKIEKLLPQARPLYQNRGKFLLNSARMSFFSSKITG